MKIRINYAQLLHQAWNITMENRKLKILAFFPSFAAIIFFVVKILWQLGLLFEEFGLREKNSLYVDALQSLSFLAENHLLKWSIFLGLFVLLFQFAFPAWINSSLMIGIQQKIERPEKYLSAREIIANGFKFFPFLFELKAILVPFALMSVSLYGIFLFRFLHGNDMFHQIVLPALLVFFLFSVFVNISTAFADFFVVCEDKPIMTAIKESIGFVFLHFEITVSLMLLMLLINTRVILNLFVILGIPVGIVFLISWLAQTAWLSVGISVAAILGIVILALTAYLTAILDVFATSLWMKAFLIVREKEKAELTTSPSKS